MNRKAKRELRKDKNLINDLYAIIVKYLPDLFNKFKDLTDTRNQSYITYSMKEICVTRLFGLLCGITSLSSLTDKFDTEIVIKNMATICNQKMNELPYWETIQDVFEKIDTNELRMIQKYIVKTLIRSKMFDKFKYNGYFQLLFDGTGLSHHDYNLNNNCLVRKHRDGKISYYKYVLECKLVVGNMVISVDSEFIENEKMITESQKQDCEINAFKRMAKRIFKNYPKQKFIITGDALYAATPIINICNNYKWKFIFNLKPDKLKNINEEFEDNITYFNQTKKVNYFLSKDISFNNNSFNVFKFIEKKKT